MTILSETTQKVATPTGHVFLIIAAVMLIICLLAISDKHNVDAVVGLVLLIIAIMCFLIGLFCCSEPHRKLKVIITDDYSAVSLYDKYDVLERDGDIWVLFEKEPMNKETDGEG